MDPILGFIAWAAFTGIGSFYVLTTEIVDEKRRRFHRYTHISSAILVLWLALNFPLLVVLVLLPVVATEHQFAIRSVRLCDRVGHLVVEVPWCPPILRCPKCGAAVH